MVELWVQYIYDLLLFFHLNQGMDILLLDFIRTTCDVTENMWCHLTATVARWFPPFLPMTNYKHLMHWHNVPSPFHALFNVINVKKSFIYRFYLVEIVQLHIFIIWCKWQLKPEFCVLYGGTHSFFLFNAVSKHCRNLYKNIRKMPVGTLEWLGSLLLPCCRLSAHGKILLAP